MLARHAPTPALGLAPVDLAPRRAPALLVGGRVVPLFEGRPVLVGAGSGCDAPVADPHVSGRHARFELRRGVVRVTDEGSTNGTWLRGVRVAGEVLAPGDAVMLARRPVLVVEAGVVPRHPRAILWNDVLAADPASLATLEAVAGVAGAEAPVYVHGESGTGKEGAALAIHRTSRRWEGPFVALNCAALPDTLAEAELFGVTRGAFTGADRARQGAFQRASGGTLLLDEVGELSLAVQAKLLRVLETGELLPVGADKPVQVDVRVIAATWRDLQRDADQGRFRFDLMQRLGVLKVVLPPLRRRRGDIAPLVDWLLERQGAPGLVPDPAALRALEMAPWNGNVRELRTVVTRAVIAGDPRVLAVGVPLAGFRASRRARAAEGPAEDPYLTAALVAAGGNRAAAARALGVSRSTLYRWLGDGGAAASSP